MTVQNLPDRDNLHHAIAVGNQGEGSSPYGIPRDLSYGSILALESPNDPIAADAGQNFWTVRAVPQRWGVPGALMPAPEAPCAGFQPVALGVGENAFLRAMLLGLVETEPRGEVITRLMLAEGALPDRLICHPSGDALALALGEIGRQVAARDPFAAIGEQGDPENGPRLGYMGCAGFDSRPIGGYPAQCGLTLGEARSVGGPSAPWIMQVVVDAQGRKHGRAIQ
ncbi:MAG: hypothetical protein RLZZ511_2831 [Cyanobacteriota bacterium]